MLVDAVPERTREGCVVIGTCQVCGVDSLALVQCDDCQRAMCPEHRSGRITSSIGEDFNVCKPCELDERVGDRFRAARASKPPIRIGARELLWLRAIGAGHEHID